MPFNFYCGCDFIWFRLFINSVLSLFMFRTLIVCHKAWIGIFVIRGLNVHSVLYTIWTFKHISPATPSAHGLDTPVHIVTISPVTPKLQPTSNQPVQFGPLFENLLMCIAGIERLIYSTKNQVQMRLMTMENQLDAIQQKLKDSL